MSVYQEELDKLPAILTGQPEGEENQEVTEPDKPAGNKLKWRRKRPT